MPETYLNRDRVIGMSRAPVAQGIMTSLASMVVVPQDEAPFVVINPEFVDDFDQVGSGSEHASDQRIDYWQQPTITITGKVNFQTAARLFLRGLGGTVAATAVTGNVLATDYTAIMQPKINRTPKFTTLGQLLGSANYRFADMMVNAYSLSQTGTQPPKFTAELMGTGNHEELTSSIITTEGQPTSDTHSYVHGAAIGYTFNDGSVVNLPADGTLLGWSLGFSQNGIIKRLPGDPFLTAGDKSSGAFPRYIKRGNRTATSQVKMFLDSTFRARTQLKANTWLTSLSLILSGFRIPGTTVDYEMEYKMARAKFMSVAGDTEDADAALTVAHKVFPDTVTDSLVSGRVRALTSDALA